MAKRLALGLLLALAMLSSFYRITGGWFYTDDFLHLDDLLHQVQHSRLSLFAPEQNQYEFLRPVIRWSWMLNFALGEFNPSGYYWFNLIVHAASILLVLELCSLLGLGLSWAGLAAFFFAFAPRKLGAVLWIAARTESLGFLFVLLAIVLWAYSRRKDSPRLRYWALLPLVISFGVKEWAPFYGFFLLALTDRYLTSRWNWRDLVLAFLLCFGYLALIALLHRGGRYIGLGWHVPKLFGDGFGQTMMPGLDFPRYLLAGQIISLIVYLLALASGPLGRFAVGWVAIAVIGPSLLLNQDHVRDWNLYPAGVGAAISLVCAFRFLLRAGEHFPARAGELRAAAAVLLLALGTAQLVTVHRWIERTGIPRGWEWRRYLTSGRELPETIGDARQRRASKEVFFFLRPSSPEKVRLGETPALR